MKVGRYTLGLLLGANVWRARDGGEPVALKRSARAAHEAAALRALSSPHVVRVLDAGDDFIVLELLDGADLGTLVKACGAMPAARVAHVGMQACRALVAVHDAGIVHRDVKPSNLFASREDHVTLIDFGVAGKLGSSEPHVGTHAYMAPECCHSEPATPASDIYSLGATLAHLLAGEPTTDPGVLPIARCFADPRSRPDARALYTELAPLAAAWTAEDAARCWQDFARVRERWDGDTIV